MRGLLIYTTPDRVVELAFDATDSDQKIRVGVGSEPGPRSAIWSFVAKASGDIYIGERSTMSMLKISLHESGVRRLAYVDEYARAKLPADLDRKLAEWSPTELAPGWRHELDIWVPADEVTTIAKVEGKRASVQRIHWVPAPSPGSATVFSLITCQRQREDYEQLCFDNPDLTPLAGIWLKRRTGIELGVIFVSEVQINSKLSDHWQNTVTNHSERQILGTDPGRHDLDMRQRLHAEGRRSVLLDLTDLPPRFIDQSII